MKKRPSLILREPVKLYEPSREEQKTSKERQKLSTEPIAKSLVAEMPKVIVEPEVQIKKEVTAPIKKNVESVKEKMSPRIRQIWDYFCKKAVSDGKVQKSFNLTRIEVMKEAGIGSTNTYRDALRKFQELNLIEIELRPGVNGGSVFTLTEKGIEQLDYLAE